MTTDVSSQHPRLVTTRWHANDLGAEQWPWFQRTTARDIRENNFPAVFSPVGRQTETCDDA